MIRSIIGARFGKGSPQAQPDPPEPDDLRPDPAPEPETTPGNVPGWAAWLQSPPGRYLLDWESAGFDAAVADVFGYHAVQLGLPVLDCLRANRMPHRFLAAQPGEPGAQPSNVTALDTAAPSVPAVPSVSSVPSFTSASVLLEHFEELPFETQSLDLVVLPHVLEFASDPHQVLREVDRVLRPEGRMIISGFNPVSLWGARQLALRGIARPFLPEDGRFIAVPRLRDWCKLLSFELEGGRYGCYRPPCRTQLWLDRTRFMEKAGDRWWPICGAVYLLAAVKRVRGMRLLGPAWKTKRVRGAVGAVAPQRRAVPAARPQLRLVLPPQPQPQPPRRGR
jgi:SAM-dependent methyltransferase